MKNKLSITPEASISLLVHIAIIVIIGMQFHDYASPVQIGDPEALIVQSYLSHETVKPVLQKERAQNKEVAKLAIKSVPKKRVVAKPTAQLEAGGRSKGEETEALLALLHAKIQAHQHYPVSAEQMNREGRVTVAFILQPDGSIHQVRVAASSGTNSLDKAALEAVSAAAPFQLVERYMTDARPFKIDVVFELG